ncbi:Serine/threonine-protein kinase PknB [Rubripirellula obstinata]|uniref:Serine/threonine-protein kinase PknB n=1 Tax=Rubripirellula obstinata TaxID=406547 RepID=A0A5B1CDI7_9BACT|nr:serine/threonine-protein kinase [Rubripirellula obstinata]KAA1257819.1 Serine/threonine-protein kinase PknB [Rubripirellula obstinata]
MSESKQPEDFSPTSLVGRRLGDYQILRKLGRGGMADVYAARHLSLGRDVAMKVLRRDLARDDDYVARFRREARAAAKISHPNIVAVYDVGSIDDTHFIVQELIDGPNLRESLDRNGPISVDDAIEILMAVGSALETAADAGITHRDIKPENIMRATRGSIKVADFGLARIGVGDDESRANLTQVGLTLGTPRYMSPEQVQGKTVDVRSDLYSLGVSMYHLLAGQPPFIADEPLALAVMHLHDTPTPLDRSRSIRDASGNPDLPEWLLAIIQRLMSKQPDDRFQTPTQLLEAIRGQADSGETNLGFSSATIRLQRAADAAGKARRRKWIHIAAMICFPIMAASAVYAWQANRPDQPGVAKWLASEEVPMGTSVEHQYLIAASRNDEAGWRSVAQRFPPSESRANARYHSKSLLQLSRLLIAQDRPQDAAAVLQELLSDPKADKIHQVLALAQQCMADQSIGDNTKLASSKSKLRALAKEVIQNDPRAEDLLKRAIEADTRAQLGLEI